MAIFQEDEALPYILAIVLVKVGNQFHVEVTWKFGPQWAKVYSVGGIVPLDLLRTGSILNCDT